MNRSSLAMLAACLVLATSAPARAATCAQPCQAIVPPNVNAVSLPLAGWLYAVETPPVLVNAETGTPRYGTWDPVKETFNPSPEFWRIGLDRLVLILDGVPHTILLAAGNPITYEFAVQNFEGGSPSGWSYSPNTRIDNADGDSFEMEVSGGAGYGSSSDIFNGGAPIGTGGGVTIKPGIPCGINGCFAEPGAVTVLRAPGLFDIEMKGVAKLNYVRAVATNPAFDCTSCSTPWQVVDTDERTVLWASVAPSVFAGPTASKLSLRFSVRREDFSSPATQYEIPNLEDVGDVSATHLSGAVQVGLVGDPAPSYHGRFDDIKFWFIEESAEDEHLTGRADRFHDNVMASFWSPVGTVTLANRGGGNYAEQADLAGLVYATNSRNSLFDYLTTYKPRLRANLKLDVSHLALDNNDSVVAFVSYGNTVAGGSRVVDLFVRKLSGIYYIRARAVNDDGSSAVTDLVPLSATAPNTIGLHWFAAGDGGGLRLAVGNQVYEATTPLVNSSRVAGSLGFGAHLVNVATPQAATVRLLWLDDIAAVY